MAEKLSVEIALEGGKEVERQLARLGKAGEQAFEDITKAAEDAGGFDKIDPTELTKKFKELGIEGAEAFDKIKKVAEQSVNTQRIAASVAELERKFEEIGKTGAAAFNKIGTAANQTADVQRFLATISEIDTKLAAVGETGKKAFGEINNAAKRTEGSGDRVAGEAEKGSSGLEELAAGAIILGQKFGQMGQSLGSTLLGALRAMGPFGIAMAGAATGAAALVVEVANAEKELAKLTLVAAKVNLSVEKYNALKDVLTNIGIAGDTASAGISKIQGSIDQVNVDKVNAAFKQLRDNATAGFGVVHGTPQLRELEEAAKGTGEAAKVAREKLAALGLPVPDSGIAAQLRAIISGSANAEEAIPKLIEKLKTIPDSLERTRAASEVLGDKLASELLRAINPANATEAALNRVKNAWENLTLVPSIVTPTDELTVSFLDGITRTLQNLKTQSEETGKELDQLDKFMWENLKGGFGKALEDMKGGFGSFAANLQQGFGPVMESIRAATVRFLESLQAARTRFSQEFGGEAKAADLVPPIDTTPVDQLAVKIEEVKTEAASTGGEIAKLAEAAATVDLSKFDATVLETIKVAIDAVKTALDQLVAALAAITWDTVTAGVTEWQNIKAAIDEATAALIQFNKQKPASGTGAAPGGGAPGNASGGLLGGRGTGTSDSNLAWVSRGEYIIPARIVAQPGVLAFLELLRRSGRLGGFASGGLAGIPRYAEGGRTPAQTTTITNFVQAFVRISQEAMNSLDKVMDKLVEGIQKIIDSMGSASSEISTKVTDTFTSIADELMKVGTDVFNSIDAVVVKLGNSTNQLAQNILKQSGGNASGGLLGGRGTGTSDSNLAWVSRGEYITPARAVAQPGVLAFLEALRRSGGNLRAVLDGMGRYALGGLIPNAVPALAGGGLGGMSNVTIQFPGLPAIGGLRASSDVVDELRKAAVLAQVRSGGRKPSRYS